MTEFSKGVDPRTYVSGHRERGPKQFSFGYAEIAAACDMAAVSVKTNAAWIGEAIEKGDLAEVAGYIFKRVMRRSLPVDEAQIEERWGVREVQKWRERWPLFDLWSCAWPGCDAWLFSKGACKDHSGIRPQVRMGPNKHFEVAVGSAYVALHLLLKPAPAGMHVHHADFNRWNNRDSNLVIVTPHEHRHLHMPRKAGGGAG